MYKIYWERSGHTHKYLVRIMERVNFLGLENEFRPYYADFFKYFNFYGFKGTRVITHYSQKGQTYTEKTVDKNTTYSYLPQLELNNLEYFKLKSYKIWG